MYHILLWIHYIVLGLVALRVAYLLTITDYLMRLWKSKQFQEMSRVLLITAHPDDECMFFGPTVLELANSTNVRVYVLCFSSGNHKGIGHLRKKELLNSCKRLGIKESNVTILDHIQLQDNPKVLWPTTHMANILLRHISRLDIDTIITFDEQGVSGHLNHISIYKCILELLENGQLPPGCRIFSLESVGWFRKYFLGFFDVYISYLTSRYMYVIDGGGYSLIKAAMEQHVTQYVWYRKLYMVFSRYVHVNTFREIHTAATASATQRQNLKDRGFMRLKRWMRIQNTEL